MDENQNPMQFNSGDELKNETFNTVRDVKETVKNMNIKEEAEKSKSYLRELVQNPIGKIKKIANSQDNPHFKTAIFAMLLWTVVAFVRSASRYMNTYDGVMQYWLKILESTISPILSILVLSSIIFIFNKENKKSLNTIITTVVTVKLPIILSRILGLLSILSTSASKITSPISSLLGGISTVGIFLAIKSLFGIEGNDNKVLKYFVIIMAVFYIADFILGFLGISI